MASIKDLKKRIVSTKNTQQTTKAMKMVSAAYLRRATEAITNQRPYAKAVGQMMSVALGAAQGAVQSPFFPRETVGSESGKKRLLLLVVTSDRGLCAGFNANVIKATQRFLAQKGSEYEFIELTFVGRKAFDFFKNRKVKMGTYHIELGGKVTFAKARKLADELTTAYTSERVDEVKVIYNLFRNAVTQETTVEDFLPLSPEASRAIGAANAPTTEASIAPMTLIKPSAQEVVADLLGKNFGVQAFRILLESQAGEHGARMSAMENATKNAGEMIQSLTLDYNKQRQAGITKELLEIIAGSESQKSA